MYISRGLLSTIADARPVLEAIASGHRTSGHRVIINTYAVVDGKCSFIVDCEPVVTSDLSLADGTPIMYETSFLKDIAELNFIKYNVPGVPSAELKVLFVCGGGLMVCTLATAQDVYAGLRAYSLSLFQGAMIAVNSTENLSFTMGHYYAVLSFRRHPTSLHFSLPWWDSVSKGVRLCVTLWRLSELTALGLSPLYQLSVTRDLCGR